MSTAPAPALPAARQLATLRMCGTGTFAMAIVLTGMAVMLLLLSISLGEASPMLTLPFVLVSLPFTFLGMAVRQVYTVAQNQEERLVRLERLLEERADGH
jgi:uncharacterized membrane protein